MAVKTDTGLVRGYTGKAGDLLDGKGNFVGYVAVAVASDRSEFPGQCGYHAVLESGEVVAKSTSLSGIYAAWTNHLLRGGAAR